MREFEEQTKQHLIFAMHLGAFGESGLWSSAQVLACLQLSQSMVYTPQLDSDEQAP